jgi:uncharacterized protein (TIGR03067 family)
MKMLVAIPVVLLVLAAPLIGAGAPNGAANGALKKLNGVWIVQSVERDPPEREKGEGKGIRCEIADGKVTAYLPGENKPAGSLTISVDPAKTPMTMTIKADGEQASLPAIYKLDNGDLTVCWKSIDEKRPPAEFSAKPGIGQTVVILAREKQPPEKPAASPKK